MSNGFFTIAQGDKYLRFAYALALSLKLSQKEHGDLSVGVTPKTEIPGKYLEVFDNIIDIPWKDAAANSSWKMENEWKSIYMTPYLNTIKLDADMLFFNDVSHWWKPLDSVDIEFATTPKTYRGEDVNSDFYRKTFTSNDLPNIYSACMYFKKNDIGFEFFKLVETITNNWQKFFYEFLEPLSRPDYFSTDVAMGIAAKIMDIEPVANVLTFTHMKSRLQLWESGEISEAWMDHIPVYFTEDCQCKLGNYLQYYPLHYFQKNFLTDEMISYMEKRLGI
jgi:hypothetical protein